MQYSMYDAIGDVKLTLILMFDCNILCSHPTYREISCEIEIPQSVISLAIE